MKFTPFVSAILLSLQFSNSLAAGHLCQPITGQLVTPLIPLIPGDSCMVYNAKKDYFPDLDFMTLEQSSGLPVCYSAEFAGELGIGLKKIKITGTVYSALTNNIFGSLALTAASVITIDGKFKIYTQDSIIDPFEATTRERLTVVGSNTGKNIKGHLDIDGNATSQAIAFAGPICIK
jgi:hypothetical protein